MYKQVIQAAVFLGIIIAPTYASADGGLLSSTTKIVESVANNGTETIQSAAADKVDSSTTTQEEKNKIPVLSQTISSVTKSVSKTTKKVTQSFSDEKPLVDVKLTEKPSIKVDAGAVKVDVSDQPSVKVDTGVIDANVSEKPSVKIDTGSVKVDVSDQPSVKVDTDVIDANVSEKPSVKINSGAVKVDVSEKHSVKINPDRRDKSSKIQEKESTGQDVSKPIVKTEEPLPVEKSVAKDIVVAQVITQPDKMDNSVEQTDSVESKMILNNVETPVKSKPNFSKDHFSAVTVSQNTPSSSSTNSFNGFSSGLAVGGIIPAYQQEFVFTNAVQYDRNQNYYDQWLNAPPAQPPQKALLL